MSSARCLPLLFDVGADAASPSSPGLYLYFAGSGSSRTRDRYICVYEETRQSALSCQECGAPAEPPHTSLRLFESFHRRDKVQRCGMESSGAATNHTQNRLELDCICLGDGHGRSLAVVGHVELSIVSMSELAVAESAQRGRTSTLCRAAQPER